MDKYHRKILYCNLDSRICDQKFLFHTVSETREGAGLCLIHKQIDGGVTIL